MEETNLACSEMTIIILQIQMKISDKGEEYGEEK